MAIKSFFGTRRHTSEETMTETINVYWSPGNFVYTEESWTYLYAYPEQISKNKFVFKATIEDSFRMPDEEINKIQKGKVHRGPLESDSFLAIFQPDRSDTPEHAIIQYNMNWVFFAEEPVMSKTTLSDDETPVKGAKFVEQKKDIGVWCTPSSLKYDIPLGSTEFSIKAGDPLFYLELDTDKEVVFHRFNQTEPLRHLLEEYGFIKERYGKARSEKEILDGLNASRMPELLLSEIKKNIANN
jgi:hypothetical protein